MPRYTQDYEKKLISFRAGDIDALKKHFPAFAYNAIVRSLVEQFVDSLKNETRPVLEFDPNKLHIK